MSLADAPERSRRRRRAGALVFAILVIVGLVGAVGFVAWRRAHVPRFRFRSGIADVHQVCFLDSGRLLLVVGEHDRESMMIEVWSLESSTPELLRRFDRRGSEILAAAPWGDRFVTHAREPERGIFRIDEARSGKNLAVGGGDVRLFHGLLGRHGRRIGNPVAALSPGGDTVALGTWDGCVELRSSSSGELERLLVPPDPLGARPDPAQHLAFSPDGRVVAAVSDRRRTIPFWTVADGALRGTTPTVLRGVALNIRASGGELVETELGFQDPRAPTLDTIAAADGHVLRSVPLGKRVAIGVSPDGRRVAVVRPYDRAHPSSPGVVDVIATDTGALVRRVPRPATRTGESSLALLSADGDRLAVTGDDGAVEVWDLP